MALDGSDRQQLTVAPDFNPQYTPDGSRIVFESGRRGLISAIWSMNPDGSGPPRLTPGWLPCWWSRRLARPAVHRLLPQPEHPAAELAVCHGDRRIEHHAADVPGEQSRDVWPAFSPDGDEIVMLFSSDRGSATLCCYEVLEDPRRRLPADPVDAEPHPRRLRVRRLRLPDLDPEAGRLSSRGGGGPWVARRPSVAAGRPESVNVPPSTGRETRSRSSSGCRFRVPEHPERRWNSARRAVRVRRPEGIELCPPVPTTNSTMPRAGSSAPPRRLRREPLVVVLVPAQHDIGSGVVQQVHELSATSTSCRGPCRRTSGDGAGRRACTSWGAPARSAFNHSYLRRYPACSHRPCCSSNRARPGATRRR